MTGQIVVDDVTYIVVTATAVEVDRVVIVAIVVGTVTGTVVYDVMTELLTTVELAGQFVTDEAQEMTVADVVIRTVETLEVVTTLLIVVVLVDAAGVEVVDEELPTAEEGVEVDDGMLEEDNGVLEVYRLLEVVEATVVRGAE